MVAGSTPAQDLNLKQRKEAVMVLVAFCLIDARDDVLCGYSPVAFSDGSRPLELSPVNGRVALWMEREYLTRLRALQDEIAEKYSKMYNEGAILRPKVYKYGLTKEEYDETEKIAESRFPGKTAAYRTYLVG